LNRNTIFKKYIRIKNKAIFVMSYNKNIYIILVYYFEFLLQFLFYLITNA